MGNFTYANKNGNGDENSGDGYKYRGRGLFQLTGRYNYTKFNQFYQANFDADRDFVNNPGEVASDTKIAVISALWYYKTRVLSNVQIDGSTSVLEVTTKINHAGQELDKRKTRTQQAKDHIEDCIDHKILD